MEIGDLMDKKAVEAARKEYDRAAECVTIIGTSSDFLAIQRAWKSFLTSHHRVFTKLDSSSKSPKNYDWWGRKVCQRRRDALLRYLFHARNADEHTIEEITGEDETRIMITEPNPRTVAAMERGLIGRPNAPILLSTEIVFKNLQLMAVVDKGDRYEVPKEYLGAPIMDPIPAIVARLGLAYLDSMLKEAGELAT
jgi:hypothetical protein